MEDFRAWWRARPKIIDRLKAFFGLAPYWLPSWVTPEVKKEVEEIMKEKEAEWRAKGYSEGLIEKAKDLAVHTAVGMVESYLGKVGIRDRYFWSKSLVSYLKDWGIKAAENYLETMSK